MPVRTTLPEKKLTKALERVNRWLRRQPVRRGIEVGNTDARMEQRPDRPEVGGRRAGDAVEAVESAEKKRPPVVGIHEAVIRPGRVLEGSIIGVALQIKYS